MNDLLTAARTAAERGWHVFPLIPDGKRPAVEDWENRATIDPARIERCWTAGPYGVGIACGPSRLVVVDLDQPKPGQSPPEEWRRPGITCGADVLADRTEAAGQAYPWNTHTVVTGRGGEHLYFTAPTGAELRNTQARLGWLIDTRACGGYVVGAGSTAAGRSYRTAHDITPAPLPGWLAEVLKPAPAPAPITAPIQLDAMRRSSYLHAAIRAETDRVRMAAEGERNLDLYKAAVALGQLVAGGSLSELDVRAILTGAAVSQVAAGAYTAWEADKTITSGLRAGAKRPRTVAA
ncbi:bifunctional DNA primase/polymerase-like protein [Kribbella orskensis]|uniref:Bifunctional DNA primase/polymerase-like protein n=1 Tax=Kribbella orskensis TaxID=2512216 RepID=A0ABY2BRK7_9ACTN|nr:MULTISPECIES: bifunctional DNA primase/polymerase [Kribbella]TCN28177.1 bifunctional DNA primase/polymerase-like protein [Kribbella sp. VKM Ac-2500]TCO27973.1 bifunctional DNA primase/polymerase-like protein [Kribbella orskensis]